MKQAILVLGLLIIGLSCKKTAGTGGTSAIKGEVIGANVIMGKKEKIEIIVTSGADLEHGDYFILNGLPGNSNYYFWFNNPTWISDGDPHLGGRTGVQVNFNYSNTNLQIAQAVYTAMTGALAADYDVSLSNDIITLTSKEIGAIPDPDDVTTQFLMDVAEQGKDQIQENAIAQADEKVYLIYGDGEMFHETGRTCANGEFMFTNLRKGNYQVYVISKNLSTGEATEKVIKTVSITGNKSIEEAGEFFIYH
jgi:hypothetical protein